MELDPPSTRPRGQFMRRLSRVGIGSVSNTQVSFGWKMLRKNPAGMWIHGLRSCPPASSSSTRVFGFALRRLASTQPAEPAPTMM